MTFAKYVEEFRQTKADEIIGAMSDLDICDLMRWDETDHEPITDDKYEAITKKLEPKILAALRLDYYGDEELE